MEKRVLIAVLLSIAVMYGYSILFPQPKTVQQKPETTQASAVTPAAVATPPSAVPSPAGSGAFAQIAPSKDITVENDLYSTVISSQNGAIKKFVLKKYKDVAGAGGKEIILFDHTRQAGNTLTSSYPVSCRTTM
jgi:YidC/Oxa1 family membrane protein insertase